MQAIEFISNAHDGVVDLPREHRHWNGKKVRVILLDAADDTTKQARGFNAVVIPTRGFQFNRNAANER